MQLDCKMESKMKIKIIQFYCGDDPVYKELVDVVADLNGEYCKRYNYKYCFEHVSREDVDNYINTNIFRWNINAYKFKVINDHLRMDDCDYLVYMDADAVVSNPTIKIEDLIDQDHSIFFSRSDSKYDQQMHMIDLGNKLNAVYQQRLLQTNYFDEFTDKFQFYLSFERLMIGYLFMNEGLIVIKNNQLMKDFFTDADKLVPYFNDIKYNTMTTDGRIIHFLTLRNKYKDSWTFMYDQAQGSYASRGKSKYNEENTFVLHDYQIQSFQVRLEHIKQLRNNQWWIKKPCD